MSNRNEKILSRITDQFNRFVVDPTDHDSFYSWRSDIELYLKRPVDYIRENDQFYSRLFRLVHAQLSKVPARWNAELVSVKMRFKWLIEDVTSLKTPVLLETKKEIEKTDLEGGSIYFVDEESISTKAPQVIFSAPRFDTRKPLGVFSDSRLTYKTRFHKCESSQDYQALASALWTDFYEVLQEREPEKLSLFLTSVSPILESLIRKVQSTDLIKAFLDTLPFLLFIGNRSPYDDRFVDCARLLSKEVESLILSPADFRLPDCDYIDDVLEYYFQSMFYFLEQGRLVAFEDLFSFTLILLENIEKFLVRYRYLPLVSELYYWIPEAYRDRLRPFILKAITKRIDENPQSRLKQLLFLVNETGEGVLDERVILAEFLKEVYKDRLVARSERAIIHNLIRELKFPPLEYRKVLREVFREIEQDSIHEAGALEKRSLMAKLIRMAMVKGEILPRQRDLLLKAGKSLDISVAGYHDLQKYVLAQKPQEGVLLRQKGLRRLGYEKTSIKLMQSLGAYKYTQLKLEEFQRFFRDFISKTEYNPRIHHFTLEGELTRRFSRLEGEIAITAFEKEEGEGEEIGILIYSPRTMLRAWFEIVNQIEYLIFDHSRTTFALEFFLANYTGRIQATRTMPARDPETMARLLKKRRGRCRIFVVDEVSRHLVLWQRAPSYLVDRSKISPLLDALHGRNFTSIKIISQIGRKKDPEEIVYAHAMVENVLFLGVDHDEYSSMKVMCEDLVKNLFPDDFKLYYYLAQLSFQTGDVEKGYLWLYECIRRKPDFKSALYLYCEHKLAENVLDPRALGWLKYLDLCFHDEERLKNLYEALEKRHSIQLKPMLAKCRLITTTLFS